MNTELVELAERRSDGVEVRLLWQRDTDEIVLEVTDGGTGTSIEVPVPGDRAMDAFNHPFVYVQAFEPLFDEVTV